MTSKPVKIVSHSIVSPLFAYVLSDKSFAINVHVKPNSKIDKIVVGTHALEIFTSTKPKNGMFLIVYVIYVKVKQTWMLSNKWPNFWMLRKLIFP